MATRVQRVDSKGRISLGPRWAGKRVRVEPGEDGGVVVNVVAVLAPPNPKSLAEVQKRLDVSRQ